MDANNVYVKNTRRSPFVVLGRREDTLVEARGRISRVPTRDWTKFEQSEFGAAILAEGGVTLVDRPDDYDDENAADDDTRSAR
jgi:hypothetical protein